MNRIKEKLIGLNPEFESLVPFIEEKIKQLNQKHSEKSRELFSQKDTLLIAYPDQFYDGEHSPLQLLKKFLAHDLGGQVSHVHILPFHPWSSDDGFSPLNYDEVEPSYGSWKDIEDIPFAKMFDCVFNHLSSQGELFQRALSGDRSAVQMFHVFPESEYLGEDFQENIDKVVRPRVSPLMTPYEFDGDKKYVWTTFSADQIDTNLSNKEMLKYVLDSFFRFIEKGARYFRVDAVPFLWKELGTSCSHHEKTHLFVQLLRAIIDEISLNLILVTESNVPHHENITYFGDGENEAHVVYNFSLAPLVLHALTFETSQYIQRWAQEVFDTGKKNAFLNFTATHDGIGMRGLEGVVPDKDVKYMCQRAKEKGGEVGMKRGRDGSEKPYELNVTWASYLKDDDISQRKLADKVVNSHAIVMFFPGISAHYVHNFLGTFNWTEGYKDSGIPRRLNRKKLKYPIEHNSFSVQVMSRLKDMVGFKASQEVFSPNSPIQILDLSSKVLSFERGAGEDRILVAFCLCGEKTSFSYAGQSVELNGYELAFFRGAEKIELLKGQDKGVN